MSRSCGFLESEFGAAQRDAERPAGPLHQSLRISEAARDAVDQMVRPHERGLAMVALEPCGKDAVGPGVTALQIGLRVFVSARELAQRGGCYAEAICVPKSAPFVLPDAIRFEDAVSLGNFRLALAMLSSNGNQPARSILIRGAASGVATALVQVTRDRGPRVIGTASAPEKRDFALANGVHEVIESYPQGLIAMLIQLTGGRGVDRAFDHFGGDLLVACQRSLAPFGMLVSYNIVHGLPTGDVFEELRLLLGKQPGRAHLFDPRHRR